MLYYPISQVACICKTTLPILAYTVQLFTVKYADVCILLQISYVYSQDAVECIPSQQAKLVDITWNPRGCNWWKPRGKLYVICKWNPRGYFHVYYTCQFPPVFPQFFMHMKINIEFYFVHNFLF